jgi:hypothetical protein
MKGKGKKNSKATKGKESKASENETLDSANVSVKNNIQIVPITHSTIKGATTKDVASGNKEGAEAKRGTLMKKKRFREVESNEDKRDDAYPNGIVTKNEKVTSEEESGSMKEPRLKAFYLFFLLVFLLVSDVYISILRLEWVSFCLSSLVTGYRQLSKSYRAFAFYCMLTLLLDVTLYRFLMQHFSKSAIYALATAITQTNLVYQVRGFDALGFYFWVVFILLSMTVRKPVIVSPYLTWVPTHVVAYGLSLVFLESVSLYIDWCRKNTAGNDKLVPPSLHLNTNTQKRSKFALVRKEDITLCITCIGSFEISAAILFATPIPNTLSQNDLVLYINNQKCNNFTFNDDSMTLVIHSLSPKSEYRICLSVKGKYSSAICVWTSEEEKGISSCICYGYKTHFRIRPL